MAEDARTMAAAYVSWQTLNNALTSLAQGVPNVVDKTAFPGLSGGVQSQLMASMKFLGLIDDAGHPQQTLHALAVTDEAARKEKLKPLLKSRYGDLFAADLEKMTLGELNDKMVSSYGVSGDTREKAVRFFLAAVAYAGIPVSRYLKQQKNGGGTSSNGTPSTPKRRRTGRRTDGDEGGDDDEAETKGEGTSRTIELTSGGTLTVTASVDMFSLSHDDRKFIFEIIDRLTGYPGTGQ